MAHSPCFSPLKRHLLAPGTASAHHPGRAARLPKSFATPFCSGHAGADAPIASTALSNISPDPNSFTGDA